MDVNSGVFEVSRPEAELVVNKETGKLEDKKEDQQEATIEHCFMLLSNITAIEHGQVHVLGLESESESPTAKKHTQFIISESIFGMFCYFNKNTSFDFVSNVMANLACQAEGRQFLVEQKYIEAIVDQMIKQKLNDHRRKFLICCLRNLLFDVETYEQKFLEMGVPSDICKVLIDEQGIMSQLPESWPAKFAAKSDKELGEVDMDNTSKLVECLFLLQKSPILFKVLKELKVQDILLKVQIPKTEEYIDVN